MSRLKFKLLGQMECQLPSGELLNLSTRKSEALLAYLAMAPDIRHSRDRLVSLLWSDRGEDQARNSLRQSLSSIKKTLDRYLPDLLEIERTTVLLKAEKIKVDLLEFKQLGLESTLDSLTRAANIYQGEFLEGLVIRDAASQQWLASERESLNRLLVEVLTSLTQLQLTRSDFRAAVESAERLVSSDPLAQSAWRMLMTAYYQMGDRNHALMAYKRCSKILQKELGVEPEAETSELHADIKAGQSVKPRDDMVASNAVEDSQRPSRAQVAENSILVLPLQNLSNDPDQQYFSEGLTESIIIGLSLFPSLKVHSRHSSFAAQKQDLSVKELGEEFNVSYIVEGSVRKSLERARINVQLIDAKSSEQLWGKRFDSQPEELFALEDQVAQSIVAIIKGKIDVADQKIAYRKPAKDMQSYDLLMRGRYHLVRFNPKDNRIGIEYLHKCLEIDPDNAAARNNLYRCYVLDWLSAWSVPRSECLEKAGFQINKAMELEPESSFIRASYAEYLIFSGEFEQAELHLDRAIMLNPNDTEAIATISAVQAALGHVSLALELADTCRRLDPFHPWVDWVTGIAYYRGKKYEDALKAFHNMPNPADGIDGWIAACYQRLGEHDKASRYLKSYLETARNNMSKFPESMDDWMQIWSSAASFNRQEGIDYPFEALCEAGLKQTVKDSGNSFDRDSLENHYSIAVLPFDNLSGDPDQEYFSDGITESIIINLSLFPGLQVKSRNSSFAFKQQIKSLGEISKELNVDYVVEGSIRKANDRIRITVQLIDAQSGNQIWGNRYECDLSNLFDLEEELSRTIAATVTGQIESDLQCISIAKDAAHQDSYDLLLSGAYYCYKFTREDTVIAVDYLNRCLRQDPECVRAHALLYMCHSMSSLERWVEDCDIALKTASEHAHKALSLSPGTTSVQTACAEYAIFCRDYEAAARHCDKALKINPNDPDAIATKAFNEVMLGNFEAGLRLAETCLRLDPYHPWCDWILADAQFSCGRYEDVLETIENSKSMPGFNRIYVTAAYVKLGKLDLATQTLQTFLQAAQEEMLSVPASIEEWLEHSRNNTPFKDTSINQGLIDCLVQAGLCDDLTEQNLVR